MGQLNLPVLTGILFFGAVLLDPPDLSNPMHLAGFMAICVSMALLAIAERVASEHRK